MTASTSNKQPPRTIIVGLSGPSSSGKTTVARLLRSIFSTEEEEKEEVQSNASKNKDTAPGTTIRAFIIHEDDFYLPDDKIPLVRNPSTNALIQDWDTLSAIDVPLLTSSLDHVNKTGHLPPKLLAITKEDQNEATDHGVDTSVIERLKREVKDRLSNKLRGLRGAITSEDTERNETLLTIAFLEGFLLYGPSLSDGSDKEEEEDPLDSVHQNIHLPIFLPAPYDLVKQRREARSGYVTIGPQPTREEVREDHAEEGKEGSGKDDEPAENKQSFWTDPPGYVDDIVWPRYIEEHAWLLLPESSLDEKDHTKSLLQVARLVQKKGQSPNAPLPGLPDTQLLIKLAGQAVNVRTDTKVRVAPGKGQIGMTELLEWTVHEVLRYLEEALVSSY